MVTFSSTMIKQNQKELPSRIEHVLVFGYENIGAEYVSPLTSYTFRQLCNNPNRILHYIAIQYPISEAQNSTKRKILYTKSLVSIIPRLVAMKTNEKGWQL